MSWRTDRNRIGPDGRPVRYPVMERDKHNLQRLEFPILDDDGGQDAGEFEDFKVMLIYEDDDIEMIPIAAIDQDDALNRALEIRTKDHNVKVKTSIVHDGLGDVLTSIAHGIEYGYTHGKAAIGRVARVGARVAGDVGYAATEVGAGIGVGAGRAVGSYRAVKRAYTTGQLERLMMDAASDNPVKRAVARREMQQLYPQVYKHIAWKRV